jgi:hypothetical protein
VISGALLEERPGRSYTKSGAFPMRLTGRVEVSGEFALESGEVAVSDTGARWRPPSSASGLPARSA